MAPHRELVDVEMYKHAETANAVFVSTTGKRGDAMWLPLSLVEIAPKGAHFIVTMPDWLAIDRGLA